MSKHAELIDRLRMADRENPASHLAADALEAQEREIEALRKKAERYDYLTLQHGDYCVAAADTAGAIFKGGAADQLIDAAKGEPHG